MEKVRESKMLRLCAILIAVAVAITSIAVSVDDIYAATAPAKVKNLKMVSKTKTSFDIKWSKVKKAKSYQIAYKKVGAKKYTYKKTSNVQYSIKKLQSGTKYKVKVRALNGKKYGAWSAEKTLKTKTAKQPAKVQNLRLDDKTASSIKVRWDKVKYAEKYQVGYKKVGAKNYTIVSTKNLYRTISKLKTDTAYYVKVRAVNGSKYSGWTTAKKITTQIDYTKAETETDIVISATSDKIKIDIKSLGLNGTGTLYRVSPNSYLKADKNSGLVEEDVNGSKIGTFKMNKKATFSISRTTNSGYDKIYDKFYVVSNGNIIKGPIYVTEIEALRGSVTLDVPSKKGLADELDEKSFEVAEDVGSNWAVLNIDFTQLLLANEDKNGNPIDNSDGNVDTIDVNGKTYYINKNYVSTLDYRISRYSKMDMNIVGIVVSFVESPGTSTYPSALKYIDDARWTNGFNTSTEVGRDYFIAGMEYIANRYSKGNRGCICNYIIGNEIDYSYDWYEIMPNDSESGKKLPPRGSKYLRDGEIETRAPFDTFMEEYSRTLRIANTAVKQYSDDITVGVSLSKEWIKSKGEQQGAQPTTNKRYDSYRPREVLDWLNYYTKKSGDFDWSVTQHNYPVANGNTSAVETGLTGKKAVITGDPDTTTMITQNNLEVLQLYLDRSYSLHDGKARDIYLTENGSSTGSEVGTPSIEMQKEQAAAIAQHYYRAASLPSVKAIIYFKINDREVEGSTSFKLGLFDTTGKKKLSYDLWKYIDTSRSFDISEKYLGSLTFLKDGKEYSAAKGNINSYLDILNMVNSDYDWEKVWDEDALTPVKLVETVDTTGLITDKDVYGADDPILVTASGSSTDVVGLYKRGETVANSPIYSYEVGGEKNGIQFKSGTQYDIRAYGDVNLDRLEDAKLPAGEYTIILSSIKDEELLRKDITITGTSAFDGKKTVSTDKKNYVVGENIIITASGSDKDWVGVYKKGDHPGLPENGGSSSIDWYYVASETQISGKPYIMKTGEKAGSASSGVLPAGEYYIVLMENDTYTELARVDDIVVSPKEAENLVSISYELENETDGFANGVVTITKREGADTKACLLYWADENGTPLEGYTALGKTKLTGTVTKEKMQANTIIPPGAKTLVAYALSNDVKSSEAVVTKLPEGAAYQFEDESKETARFVIGSDLHLVERGKLNEIDVDSNGHFKTALEDAAKNLPGASGFFVNGDITDAGKASQYKEAMNILMGVEGAPDLHLAIGNHDWYEGNPDGQFQKYANWFNPAIETETVYYDEWVDGYHFIYLGGEEFQHYAVMSDEQLNWLDELLAADEEAGHNKPTFVFLHQGLQDSMAGNFLGQWGYDSKYGVGKDQQLRNILSKYGQVILFGGHTHYALDSDNSITPGSEDLPVCVNTSSVSYLWDAFNIDTGEYREGSESYHVRAFEDKLYMFGRNHLTGEYVSSALYVLEYADLSVEHTEISMHVGDDSIQIDAKAEEGMQLSYRSSNNKVVAVDYRGHIRPVAPGTAKIYVSTESSNTKTINRRTITVTVE
ncbi:MAG: fibronectin type III domain-containing protein [Firmicutes bacterium]|nr:fibronectin type III domain-containing protein [Bacillota bacterium]